MPNQTNPLLQAALANFGVNLRALLGTREMSEAALERELMRRKRKKVSAKTINNIVNNRHPAQIDNLAAIAEFFEVPLWVMFLPELPKELLQNPFKERLVRMVENYLLCDGDGRQNIESIAAVFAAKKKLTED
jgi:transcriptional regulator with XRE-family HTH domain